MLVVFQTKMRFKCTWIWKNVGYLCGDFCLPKLYKSLQQTINYTSLHKNARAPNMIEDV